MKHFIYIMGMITCVMLNGASAQTPYDAFAPEASRPILELVSNPANDTVLDPALVSPVTDDIRKWSSVDPLTDKYPGISPYAYCGWNPIRYIDPDGMDWYEEDGQIKWTDCKSQQEMINLSIDGHYLGEAVIIFEGAIQERFGTINGKGKYIGGDNAILANVTLYGPNSADDITNDLVGFTMTSDYEKYGAIDNGWYRGNYDSKGKSGEIKSNWVLENRGKIPTLNGEPNPVKESNYYLQPYKDGIFIHSTLREDNKVGSLTSKGCLLLDRRSMNIFNSKMHGVKSFGVHVIRR